MTRATDDVVGDDLRQLALSKMANVLGEERARMLFQRITAERGLSIATPDELHDFGGGLVRLGGFEGAVGAMLQVAAVIRGARRA